MSAKKSKTTSSEQYNKTATTTPNVPTWLQQPYENVAGQVNGLLTSGQPLISGPSALQNQAFAGAGNLTTSPLYGQAADLANQAANAGASSAGPAQQATARNFTDVQLDPYMNNGLNGLLDAASADYAATGGRVNAAQAAQAAANGGARNSNNAIRDAITQGELSRAANTGLSQLRYDAFNSAANLAQNDLNREASTNQFNAGQVNQNSMFNAGQQDNALARMLQSAGVLANVGQAQGADERANIGLQAGLGEQQRDIANQGSEAARLAMLQQLLGGIPIDAFTGSTQTGSGSGSGKNSSTQFGFDLADFWTPKGGFK